MKIGDKVKTVDDLLLTCVWVNKNYSLLIDENGLFPYLEKDGLLFLAKLSPSPVDYVKLNYVPYTDETFDKDRDLFFKHKFNNIRARATSYGAEGLYIGWKEMTWLEFFEEFTRFDGTPAGYLEDK